MTARILVINPNCSDAVTRGIDEACAPLRIPGGPAIDIVSATGATMAFDSATRFVR